MSLKSKDLSRSTKVGVQIDTSGGNVDEVTSLYRESAVTTSKGHYGWQEPTKFGDVGGSFTSFSDNTYKTPSQSVWITRNQTGGFPNQLQYKGVLTVQQPAPMGEILLTDGGDYGADAYDRMKPTKPSFEAWNALYELKDVPFMLSQRFTKELKSASNWWLALQFGWGALFNDIANLYFTYRNIDKRVRWLIAHNGKPVRRNALLREAITLDVGGDNPLHWDQSFVSQFYGAQHSTYKLQDHDRVWASARFRYWLPDVPPAVSFEKSLKAALYGLHFPRPYNIWRAMPWTWLADWFFTTGKILSNLDAGVADRLAADYFYIMRSRDRVATWECSGTFFQHDTNFTPIEISASTTRTLSYKTRIAGDPFGFNTSQGDLSGMQLSILGALGHSHI